MKKWILAGYLLAAIVLGAVLAALCEPVGFLSWMALGKSIGVPVDTPFILDLSVVKFAFGFELGINVAQIICVVIAAVCYSFTLGYMRAKEQAAYAAVQENKTPSPAKPKQAMFSLKKRPAEQPKEEPPAQPQGQDDASSEEEAR